MKKIISIITSCFLFYSFVCVQIVEAFVMPSPISVSINKDLEDAVGKIADSFLENSQAPQIIFIQDLHTSSSVQKNIAKIIDIASKNYNLDKVMVEGAPFEKIDMSFISNLSKFDISKQLVDDGLLSGSEYYFLNYNQQANIFGLEDWNIYLENIKRASEILKDEDYKKELFGEFKKDLYSKIPQSEKLIKYVKFNLTDSDLIKEMDQPVLQYVSLYQYWNLLEVLEKIDFKKVSKENISLMRDLQSVLSYDEYSKLINMSKQNNPLYYATLYSLFKNNNELTEKYKSLYTFLIYATKIKSMDSFELLSQRDDYLSDFLNSSSLDNQTKESLFILKMTELFENFLTLVITEKDYNFFVENYERYIDLLSKYLSQDYFEHNDLFEVTKIFNYHDLNIKRNDVFVDNILKDLKSKNTVSTDIVIAGGFHSSILNQLKKKNISYLLITPSVNNSKDNTSYNEIVKSCSDESFDVQALAKIPLMLTNSNVKIPSITKKIYLSKLIKEISKTDSSVQSVSDVISKLSTSRFPIRAEVSDKSFYIIIGSDKLEFAVKNGQVVWEEREEIINVDDSSATKGIKGIIPRIKSKFDIYQATSMKLNPNSQFASSFLSVRSGERKHFMFSLSMVFNFLHHYLQPLNKFLHLDRVIHFDNLSYSLMSGFAYAYGKMQDKTVKYEIEFDGKAIDVFVEKDINEFLSEQDLQEIFKEAKERIDDSISYDKKSIFIGFLSKSTNLFEDHLNNGFIGVNEGLMGIEDPVVKKAFIRAGIIHEFSHEIKGPLGTKEEYDRFEEIMMFSDIKYIIEYVTKSFYANQDYESFLYTNEYNAIIKRIISQLLKPRYNPAKKEYVPLFDENSRFIRKFSHYGYDVNNIISFLKRKDFVNSERRGQLKHIEMSFLKDRPEIQEKLFQGLVNTKKERPSIPMKQFLEENFPERKQEVDKQIQDFRDYLKATLISAGMLNTQEGKERIDLIVKEFNNNINSALGILYQRLPTYMFSAFYNEDTVIANHALNHSLDVLRRAVDIMSKRASLFTTMKNDELLDFIQTMVYSAMMHDLSCILFRVDHERNSSTWAKAILNGILPNDRVEKISQVCLGHKKVKGAPREEHKIFEARLLHDADGFSAALDLERILGVWLIGKETFFNPRLTLEKRIELIQKNKYMMKDGGDAINDLVRQFNRRRESFYLTGGYDDVDGGGAKEIIESSRNPEELIKFLRDKNVREQILTSAPNVTNEDIDKAVEVVENLLANLMPEKFDFVESVFINQDESEFDRTAKVNLFKKIVRYFAKKQINFEKIYALSDIHGGYKRLVELIYSLFYANMPMDEMIQYRRQSLSEEENISKTDYEIAEDFIFEKLSEKDNDTLFYVLGDLLDRGDKQVQSFQFMKKLFDKGKAKYVVGNHDLYAFMNLLGLHLPYYANYKGISADYTVKIGHESVNIINLLNFKRGNNAYGVNNKNHWAQKIYEYMQNADAIQAKWTKEKDENGLTKEARLQNLFEKTFGFKLDDKGIDILNNPDGLFAEDEELLRFHKKFFGRNVGIVVYTGIRAVGKMSINWWKDRNEELANLKERYPQYESYWNKLQQEIDSILQEQQNKMENEYQNGNWEWAVVDSIMYKNYESTEWNALDWAYHKNWGGGSDGFIAQRNRQIQEEIEKEKALIRSNSELSEEEKAKEIERLSEKAKKSGINQVSYLDDSVVSELLNFYKNNFYLYRKDRNGFCYLHSILPVDEEGDISIGYVDENGVFQERDKNGKRIKGFIYKGKHYKNNNLFNRIMGTSIFDGLEAIAKDIRNFDLSTNDLSKVYEGLTIITSIYADNTTRVKPANLMEMKEKFGFGKVLKDIGPAIVGHNPVTKFDTSFEYTPYDWFGRKLKEINLVHIDGNMSPAYGGAGLIRIIGGGIATRGFPNKEATRVVSSTTPDVDFNTFITTATFNLFPWMRKVLSVFSNFATSMKNLFGDSKTIKLRNTLFIKNLTLSSGMAQELTKMEQLYRKKVDTLVISSLKDVEQFSIDTEIDELIGNDGKNKILDKFNLNIGGKEVNVDVYIKEIKLKNRNFKMIVVDYDSEDVSKEEVMEQVTALIFDGISENKYSYFEKYKNILSLDSNSSNVYINTKATMSTKLALILENTFGLIPLLSDIKVRTVAPVVTDVTKQLSLDKIQNMLSAA